MTIKSLSSSQIALIMKKGGACSSGSFLLKKLNIEGQNENQMAKNLIYSSFIASKKTFTLAVQRNKARRRLKNAFIRAVKELEKEGVLIHLSSFVFLSKKSVINENFSSLVGEVRQTLLKNCIIKQ